MFHTNAVFSRKESGFEPRDCIVEKVIRLSGAEYDRFAADMLQDYDFIRENKDLMRPGPDGQPHCLLVVGEGRRDGVLVDSSGYDYARYSAFIPNAEDFLTVGRSPALAALNKKLTEIVDIFAEQAGAGSPDGRGVVNLQNWDALFGLDLTANGTLLNTVLDMLGERPEIKGFELNRNELTIYREPDGGGISKPSESEREFEAWRAVTEGSRFRWTEDVIFRLNGRGAFYYIGGEDGCYMKIHKDGALDIGTYEGAIPHIGEAFFNSRIQKQYGSFNEAFEAACTLGGRKFLVDMFSADAHIIPSVEAEKSSVMDRIKAARQTGHAARESKPPARGKDKGGPEL